VVGQASTQSFGCGLFCLATNQIAQTGLSSLPPVIYYSEQLFRISPSSIWGAMKGGRSWRKCPQDFSSMNKRAPLPEYIMAPPHATLQITMTTDLS
ncbi:hypothetical protein, partial [Aeromonas caviae]|uniref:hypothetical protein n=1 Tax=Aeromonas caviae TaxID=648 RepID=UPI0025B6397A